MRTPGLEPVPGRLYPGLPRVVPEYLAKQVLSYFQGPVADWSCADQRLLRRAIPENRLRVYDVRQVIELMVDTGSFLELRFAAAGP